MGICNSCCEPQGDDGEESRPINRNSQSNKNNGTNNGKSNSIISPTIVRQNNQYSYQSNDKNSPTRHSDSNNRSKVSTIYAY